MSRHSNIQFADHTVVQRGDVKEHAILFSPPMVRALLDGSKSQTRRVVKPQPKMYEPGQDVGLSDYTCDMLVCPYGQPGHRIWVRETFYAFGRWETRHSAKKKRDEWHFVDMTVECDRHHQYAADNPDVPLAKGRGGGLPGWYKRPAIFMPRAACRILLKITGVRMERLDKCSAADARAEGLVSYEHFWRDSEYPLPDAAYEPFRGSPVRYSDPIAAYAALWESINGADIWNADPWVWCIEFSRVAP